MTLFHRLVARSTANRRLLNRDVVVVCGGAATATVVTYWNRHGLNINVPTLSTSTTRSFASSHSNRMDSVTMCDANTAPFSTSASKLELPTRHEMIQQLVDSNKTDDDTVVFDILVIGAGATGCGIALDAASRGLRVACIERSDIASETSSRSTKLLWAGIRYLATAAAMVLNQPLSAWWTRPSSILSAFWSEFQMVRACHRERNYMLHTQRHLSHWMPIAVPFTSFVRVGLRDHQPPPFGNSFFLFFPALAPLVFTFYDALGSFANPRSYVMGPQKAAATILPNLRLYRAPPASGDVAAPEQPWIRYLSVFGEGMHNDARTCLAIAQTAIAHGAVVCNYVEAVDLIPSVASSTPQAVDEFAIEGAHSRIPVQGAMVRDQMTGKTFPIQAKQVILAGGPFTDQLRSITEPNNSDTSTRAIRESAGTHIVLRGGIVPANMGLLDFNTSDGRFLFVLPWLGHTLVGTTDDPKGRTQSRHDPPEHDIDYLLQEIQTYLKLDSLQRSDVLSAWRGWRPLALDPHAPAGAAVSRDHVISQHPSTGIFFIAGGKWTTWREMAEEVVDRVLEAAHTTDQTAVSNERVMTMTTTPCRTLDIVLHGGDTNFDAPAIRTQFQRDFPTLEPDIVSHLVETYGVHVWDVAALFNDTTKSTTLQQRLVPDFPYIEAEVIYACRHEYACTIADILSRRTRLSYLNITAAHAALPRVAQLMNDECKWSRSFRKQQVVAAEQELSSFGGPVPNASSH